MKHRFEYISRKDGFSGLRAEMLIMPQEEDLVIDKFLRLWLDDITDRKGRDNKFADIIKFGSVMSTNSLPSNDSIIRRLYFNTRR